MCAKGGGKVQYKIDPEQARNAAYQQLTSLANYQPSYDQYGDGLQKYQSLQARGTPPPFDLPDTSPPEPAPPEPVDPMEARFKGLIMDEEKK